MQVQDIARSFAARIQARRRLPAAMFALAFFEVFSAGSTTYGLHAFFNGFSEFAPWVGWTIIFALAAGLHSVEIAYYYRFRETRRLTALAPALVLSLIFIGFSWSWHWGHFAAPAVSQADYAHKSAALESTLVTEGASMQLMADKTGALEAYSDDRAREEDKAGGTCGDHSGPIKGKRYKVRISDRNEAHGLAELARQRLARLDLLGSRVHALASDPSHLMSSSKELDDITAELSAFAADDPVIADIKDRAQQRLRLSREGYSIPGNGLVRCPDPTRDELLQGVLNAAKMPSVSFERVLDPASIPEAQKRVWGRAANTIVMTWKAIAGGRVDSAVADDTLTFPDYVALATASIVEALVLLCMFLLPRPRRGARAWAEQAASLNDESARNLFQAMRRLAAGGVSPNKALLSLIESHLWWLDANADPFLVVPIAPQELASSELFWIGEWMIELGMARVPHSYSTFCRRLRRRRDAPAHLAALARIAVLRLYRIDRHAYRRLMLMFLLGDQVETFSPPRQRGPLVLPAPAPVSD